MATWIRTQNKESITDGVTIYYCSTGFPPYEVGVIYLNGRELTLGEYSTKAKAMEALDSIWDTLSSFTFNNFFVMPKDSTQKIAKK